MINEYSQTYQMHPGLPTYSHCRQPVDQVTTIPLLRVNSEDGRICPGINRDGKRLLFGGKNTSLNLSEDDEDVFIAEYQVTSGRDQTCPITFPL